MALYLVKGDRIVDELFVNLDIHRIDVILILGDLPLRLLLDVLNWQLGVPFVEVLEHLPDSLGSHFYIGLQCDRLFNVFVSNFGMQT